MANLIRTFAVLTALLTASCGSLPANERLSAPASAPSMAEQRDFSQLFSLFIRAPTPETYVSADNALQYDELKAFKVLDDLYARYKEPDGADKSYSRNRLKAIAFFAHLAEQHNNAALNEYLAADLVPIYQKNPERFLSVLAELPFLTPSNCERLNAHFGFEGKHANTKGDFSRTNGPLMKKLLGQPLAEVCLSKF